MTHTIRIDDDVYARLLDLKGRLEAATNRVCSISDAVAFLIAMRGEG